jgi:hypothetical protein
MPTPDDNVIEGDGWQDLPICDFQADGRQVVQFLLLTIEENGSLRAPKRDRPYQPGAKLDNVAANADDFVATIQFHNSLDEPGLSTTLRQWPDAVEEVIGQFHTGETGTLNLPWKRGIRCKAMNWRRVENASSDRGGAIVTVTFTTDNEDAINREAFQLVSVRAQTPSAVADATFDADSQNMFDGSIEDITSFAADLVGLMNAPDELVGTIVAASRRLSRAVTFLMAGFQTAVTGRDSGNDPDTANTRLKLLALLGLAAQAEGDAIARLPKSIDVTYPWVTDIWSVASELSQPSALLIELNDAIEDLSYIERGTPIKVPA